MTCHTCPHMHRHQFGSHHTCNPCNPFGLPLPPFWHHHGSASLLLARRLHACCHDARCHDARCHDARCSDARCSNARYTNARYDNARCTNASLSSGVPVIERGPALPDGGVGSLLARFGDRLVLAALLLVLLVANLAGNFVFSTAMAMHCGHAKSPFTLCLVPLATGGRPLHSGVG